MRTVVTYLDKDKNRTTKENAWTVMTQVFNDAGNLQRTGYSIGEAQTKASQAASSSNTLNLHDETAGKEYLFSKNVVRVGRDSGCDIVFDQKEDKKKIDKIHAVFELRQGVWHVMDLSKSGVWINGERVSPNAANRLQHNDVIDFGGRHSLIVL